MNSTTKKADIFYGAEKQITLSTGDKYTGELRDGLPHGRGKCEYVNGNVYDGQWKQGKRHGKGVMIYVVEEEDSDTKKMPSPI